MIKKHKTSQFYYKELFFDIEQKKKELQMLQDDIKKCEAVENCSKCHGRGEVPIGNIHCIYGFRLGDNGYEKCGFCNGKGY